jgi:hypothetical protein
MRNAEIYIRWWRVHRGVSSSGHALHAQPPLRSRATLASMLPIGVPARRDLACVIQAFQALSAAAMQR